MSYEIEIDEFACSAHGDCAVIAPKVFRVDDIATVIGTDEPEVILAAAQACPAGAIAVFDSATGEQVYP